MCDNFNIDTFSNMLTTLLELIFPERKDHAMVRGMEVADLIKLVKPTQHQEFISLLPFTEPLVRALIHEAKFHHNEKAWNMLGAVLASYLKHFSKETIVIPIPLSKKRRQSRKYNQVEKIAQKAMQNIDHISFHTDILSRCRDTVPQTSLKRSERLKNVTNAFAVHNSSLITDKNIIILDDVATTGATLKAAEASLRPHHPSSITCLALAH